MPGNTFSSLPSYLIVAVKYSLKIGSSIRLDVSVVYKIQVESGALTEPLWDTATVPYPYPNNAAFVREYTIKLLSSSFPNMTAAEVSTKFITSRFALFVQDSSCFSKSDIEYQLIYTGHTICEWTLRVEK